MICINVPACTNPPFWQNASALPMPAGHVVTTIGSARRGVVARLMLCADSGWAPRHESIEQFGHGRANDDDATVGRRDEALGHRTIEHSEQGREKPRHVQQTRRLVLQTELCPGDGLAVLLARAETSRQRDESIATRGHLG